MSYNHPCNGLHRDAKRALDAIVHGRTPRVESTVIDLLLKLKIIRERSPESARTAPLYVIPSEVLSRWADWDSDRKRTQRIKRKIKKDGSDATRQLDLWSSDNI